MQTLDSELTAVPDTCELFHAGAERIAGLRARALSADSVRALAEIFKILGDETRVRILDVLAREELCVCDIATLLGLTESAVSHQLRLLRSMRVVRARRAGRMAFYALDDQHIRRLFEDGLRHVEEAEEGHTSSAARPLRAGSGEEGAA